MYDTPTPLTQTVVLALSEAIQILVKRFNSGLINQDEITELTKMESLLLKIQNDHLDVSFKSRVY